MDIAQLRKNTRYAIKDLKKVTIRATAARAGISERHLLYFLSGESDMTLTKFFQLCDAIGMPIEAILHLYAE